MFQRIASPLGAIHQRRLVEGGGCANVDDLGWGGGQPLTGRPQANFWGVSRVRI